MKYFDYMETEFVLNNRAMSTGNPEDITVPRQARANAILKMVGVGRTLIQFGYMVYLAFSFLFIKLRLRPAPERLSTQEESKKLAAEAEAKKAARA